MRRRRREWKKIKKKEEKEEEEEGERLEGAHVQHLLLVSPSHASVSCVLVWWIRRVKWTLHSPGWKHLLHLSFCFVWHFIVSALHRSYELNLESTFISSNLYVHTHLSIICLTLVSCKTDRQLVSGVLTHNISLAGLKESDEQLTGPIIHLETSVIVKVRWCIGLVSTMPFNFPRLTGTRRDLCPFSLLWENKFFRTQFERNSTQSMPRQRAERRQWKTQEAQAMT